MASIVVPPFKQKQRFDTPGLIAVIVAASIALALRVLIWGAAGNQPPQFTFLP
jgi:hypothetical protein